MSYRPPGCQNVIANLVFKNAKDAVALYQSAFGAEIKLMDEAADGSISHGSIKILDTIIFVCDESDSPPRTAPAGPVPISLFIYLPNADATFASAQAAGMSVVRPPFDSPTGHRMAIVRDEHGYTWTLATDNKPYGHCE